MKDTALREGALKAMGEARKIAYERAARFGHNIPIGQDGMIVYVNPRTEAIEKSSGIKKSSQ